VVQSVSAQSRPHVGEDQGTIEEVYEPFLVQNGFLQRTSRGRMATAQLTATLDSFSLSHRNKLCSDQASEVQRLNELDDIDGCFLL
jgi:hypothetical protein